SSKIPSLSNLTLTKTVPKKTHLTSEKESTVKGMAESKPLSISESYLNKNSNLTTEKLLLTLMEEDNPEPAEVQASIINEPISKVVLLISKTSQSEGPPLPQDRWSRDGHIELVNIIGEPLIEPKRLSEALKE
ncbi:hypothetical protein Tco_1126489, partial [Tanacetum coccineum]